MSRSYNALNIDSFTASCREILEAVEGLPNDDPDVVRHIKIAKEEIRKAKNLALIRCKEETR